MLEEEAPIGGGPAVFGAQLLEIGSGGAEDESIPAGVCRGHHASLGSDLRGALGMLVR